MEIDAQLRHIDEQGEALLVAAAAAPNAGVVACPAWTNADLAFHIGSVHAFWAWIVRDRRTTPDGHSEPDRPDDVIAWARERREALVAALRSTSADTAIWTWSNNKTVGFVSRWQVVEATVHRIDSEIAAQRDFVITPEVAGYGIDAFLEFCRFDPHPQTEPVAGSVHVHCTDTLGEWFLDRDNELRREHAAGDAAIRGRAQDVLCALFRRVGLDACEVLGDRSVAQRFVARESLG